MVVGGSGFIGFYTVKNLVDRGAEVIVTDIVPPDSAWRLSHLLREIEYRWVSSQDMKPFDFDGVDCVIYLAAQTDVPLSLTSPLYTFQANVISLISVLETLQNNKSKAKFIYMSSDAVYGAVPPDRFPITEEEPLKPTNPYGISKATADLLCQSYLRLYGLPVTVLRSGTIFGQKSRLKQVMPIFIKQALKNEPITIEGDGSQSRDFNYVENVIDAIMLVANSKTTGVYNIGSGEERTILDVAREVIESCDSKSQILSKPWRAGEKGLRLPLSVEKAKRELGYKPRISFKEGLAKTIEWIKNIEK